MKKIAFLINSLGKGGAERVAVSLMEGFAARGTEILLVTSRKHEDEYTLSVPVKRILFEKELKPGLLGKIPARIKILKKIWQEEKPEAVVSFIGKMNIYACASLKGMNIPLILSVRSDPAREYPGIDKFLAENLFVRAKKIVFQTEAAKQAFSKKIESRGIILKNALSEAFLKPIEKALPERKKEILMIGRLDKNKNHALLIKAFSELKDICPEWNIVIYGEGREGESTLQELSQLAEEKGMSGRVCFAGSTSRVAEKMDNAQIFVLCSGFEGMPNALLEAMSRGMAVISTDCPCGGPASVIKSGKNGLLIPVDGEAELKEALKELILDENKRYILGKEAERIREELEPEAVFESWRKIIEC